MLPVMVNSFARELRKNPTDAEQRLWWRLRGRQLGFRFRRQSPIGVYIVDFVCYEARLIVECDGGQHVESTYDLRRDDWLSSQGFRVLRFWNNDVLRDSEMVLERILRSLRELAPHPNPPPRAARGGREEDRR